MYRCTDCKGEFDFLKIVAEEGVRKRENTVVKNVKKRVEDTMKGSRKTAEYSKAPPSQWRLWRLPIITEPTAPSILTENILA